MEQSVYITDEMRAAVGRETRRKVSFPVAASDIRRWAIAIYFPEEPPQQFWKGDVVAPEEFNPFAWMVADPIGETTGFKEGGQSLEASLGLAEVATVYMLNGGTEITYGMPIRPGDVITAVGTLTGYHEREGRLGTMLFTRSTDTWTNQAGDFVKASISTVIRY